MSRRCFSSLFGALALLLLTPFALVSTGSAEPSHSDEYVFLLKGRGNIFWKVIREGVEETAKNLGIHAVVLNTDDDQTPEAQLNMCLSTLARKPRVLVLGAHTKAVGIQCFRKAVEAGVLVADIDGNVTVDDAKSAGIQLAFSVGSDNTLIGKQAADHLSSSSQTKTPKILLLKGLPGSIVSEKRAMGFTEALKSASPGAEVKATFNADWDRMKAMNIALDFMQREPELAYIFSVSDVMTMGVVEAVRVAGKEAKVKIISVDGITDARNAILQGRMDAVVAQLPYLMGKRAVELSLKAAQENLRDFTEFTPTPTLTKSVLEKHDDPNLVYLR